MITENPDSNEELLQALALRLLGKEFPGDSKPESVQIIVGRLPDQLPVEIPLPENSRILGSYVNLQWQTIYIEFDTDLPVNSIFDFYRERLLSSGWHSPQNPRPMGGFHPNLSTNRALFCRSQRGPSLSIYASTLPHQLTQVSLGINSDPNNRSCANISSSRDLYEGYELIPSLTPPVNSKQFGQQSGSSGDNANSRTMLETNLDLLSVTAHYQAQLRQVGWTCFEQGQGGSLAWSTWRFRAQEEESWYGLFFVFKMTETPLEYLLQLQVNRALQN
ncbi:MAG: hypothetical protein U7123_13255 [Potamolinea sp.]